jgi:hypothetical protein
MNTTVTRRIVTALTGPAIAAGILAGGLALGAPAQAQTTVGTATCVTAPVLGASPNMPARTSSYSRGAFSPWCRNVVA